jgi:hypothetical protein
MRPAKRIRLYAIRVDVEPLHDGHAAQQSEQNALLKQHAIDEPRDPIQRTICCYRKTVYGSKNSY